MLTTCCNTGFLSIEIKCWDAWKSKQKQNKWTNTMHLKGDRQSGLLCPQGLETERKPFHNKIL